MAKIVELIETEEHIGDGTREKPYSIIRTYWDKDGNIIAENIEDVLINQWYVKQQYITRPLTEVEASKEEKE